MELTHTINLFAMIFMCLLINTQPSSSISTHRIRAISAREYSPNSQLPPEKINWELGLREATFHALVRERINEPQLKEQIFSAPILGFQDTATPFGDIAVLARGQLYSTPNGYRFIQDVYRNDCDDCHNKSFRCQNQQCQAYRNQNSKSLVALWTVKRIRHRDLKVGHRYEVQFTVSPMSPSANADFVTRNGHFDYGIPGHVFIIKIKNSDYSLQGGNIFERSEKYKSDVPNGDLLIPPWSQWPVSTEKYQTHTYAKHNDFTPNAVNLHTGEFYIPGKQEKRPTPDTIHTGFLIGIQNDYKPVADVVTTHLSHERPYGMNNFYTKTNEYINKNPVKHYHHHFFIPEVADIENYDKSIITPVIPTTSTNNAHQYIPNIKPTFTTTQKYILTGVPNEIISQPTQRIPHLTTDHSYNFRPTYKYPDTTIPIPIQPIIFNPSPRLHTHTIPTFGTLTNNPQTILKLISIPPTQPTPFSPSPYYIQYSDPDPTYANNQPPTVAEYITNPIHPTAQPTSATFITQVRPVTTKTVPTNVFNDRTEMPTTTVRGHKLYPDSINVQLPPPKNGMDTTIPYVSSTMLSIVTNPIQMKHTESLINKVQIKRVEVNEENEATTMSIDKKIDVTTIKNEENTDIMSTTPNTNIMKPFNETRTTEKSTTPLTILVGNTMKKYSSQEVTTEQKSTFNDTPTTQESVTRRYNDQPLNNKPSYLDDFDIFAESYNTDPSTKKSDMTDKKSLTYDEIFSTTDHTTQSTTSTTLKNARISKYLKYKRNRGNRLNKYSRTFNSERLKNRNFTKPQEILDENVETKTSQSLITSISFKVNKNGSPVFIPTNTDKPLRANTYEVNKNTTEFNVFKAELPQYTTASSQNTKVFDDLAQSLVNHARLVTYFDTKSTKSPKHLK